MQLRSLLAEALRYRLGVLKLAAVVLGIAGALALMGGAHAAGLGQGPGTQEPASPVPPPAPPPFFWVDESLVPPDLPKVSVSGPPLLPDLSIQWIERTPRYHRYCVDYGRGLPELCPGTEADQRFPEPGDVVTLTARIANQGEVASPSIDALWTTGSGPGVPATVPPLGPGITATLAITWPWPADPLSITLSLDPAGLVDEITRANNLRVHRTDALYLDVAVHPLVDAAFAQRANLVGSRSFADWMQAQVDTMNADLAASAYPSAAGGALDRVRIDRILVTDAVGGSIVTSTLDFDGRWTFRVEPDDPDTPEDEALLSAEGYAATFAQQIDWGLIHELTHQLGAIDLYQLNVAPSYQNEVADGDGRPLLMGFDWPRPDLMGGGDRGDYPWYRYSEHTALALNANAGQRRGYFGEYLYDLPARIGVRVLDAQGQPLPGVEIAAYQTASGVVAGQPVFTGATDAGGRFVLPARPVPFGGVTTATGHTLASNPFGAIDVVGMNGQLLLRLSKDGQSTYTWWTLTDLNLAAWHGLASVERTIRTHFPATGAPAPPAHLDGRVDGLDVTLTWPASPAPGVIAYRVYRGEEPAYYPFTLVATTASTTYRGESGRTARYAVTAVDAQGRESGYSPIFRAPRLVAPTDAIVDPTNGLRTVLDRHDGALVTQMPDSRWIGRQGSVHLGLTAAEGLTRNAQGQILVAATGDDRIKVVDPRWPVDDSTPQVVNWFGRERFVTATLASPVAVVQAGPAFTVARKPQPDGATLGLASFDNRLDLSGAAPLLATGVTLASGRFDGGVRVNTADRLEYDAAGHVDPNQGSLELWVRPEWVWDDDEEHVFVEIGTSPPSPLGPISNSLGPISNRAPNSLGPVSDRAPILSLGPVSNSLGPVSDRAPILSLGPVSNSLGPVSDRAPILSLAPSPPGGSALPDRALPVPSYRLRLAKASWNGLYAWLADGTHDMVLYAGIDTWQPGQWHHLAVAWQAVQPGTAYHRYTLWVDGILRDSQVLRRPVDGPFDRLAVGAGLNAADQADAILDELRLSAVPRLGNSQQVRLIISQRAANLVSVADWLGNPVSRLGGQGTGPGQWDAPQGLALRANRLWVADTGNGRIQILDFDGTTLTPVTSWSSDLGQPYDVVMAPDDRVLVSDWADNQVKLFDHNGQLVQRWTGPTDGHDGRFARPAGLAWLPAGDILVADMNNGRVVRIADPLRPRQIHMPFVTASSPP